MPALNVFFFFRQEADNSSSLGRLKNQLRLYYTYQVQLAIKNFYMGKMAAVIYSQGLLSTMHFDFSKVNILLHKHTPPCNSGFVFMLGFDARGGARSRPRVVCSLTSTRGGAFCSLQFPHHGKPWIVLFSALFWDFVL